MSLPATDGFTGTGPISTNWTIVLGGWDRNADTAESTALLGQNLMYWSADSFNADQKATITYTNVVAGGPAVRVSGAGGGSANGYVLSASVSSIQLHKFVNSTTTSQIWDSGETTTANGDVIRLEAEGTTLRVYRNSSFLNSPGTTDSDLASGNPGLYRYSADYGLDDFVGDNLTSSGGGTSATGGARLRWRRV